MNKFILLALLLILPRVAVAAPLWEADFEENDTSEFSATWLQNTNCTTGSTISATAGSKLNGNYGLNIYYEMDDDPRGDCQQHQDNNTSGIATLGTEQSHFTFDGYFQFPIDTTTFCRSPITQRKLVYFKAANWPTSWAYFLKWETSGAWTCSTDGGQLILGYGNAGGSAASIYGEDFDDPTHSRIKNNTWYHLRVEVEYGTYGNDRMQIWLGENGSTFYKIFDRNNLTLRSSSDQSTLLSTVEIGRQVDVNRTDDGGTYIPAVYENRYWDDLSIYSGSFPTSAILSGGTVRGGTIVHP
jgi:hypothetical protein